MKYLRVKFSNGEEFDVPADIIAINRAEHYVQRDIDSEEINIAERDEALLKEIAFALEDEYELTDWAFNNMDWSDVEDVAERVHQTEFDYDDEWCSVDHEIVER